MDVAYPTPWRSFQPDGLSRDCHRARGSHRGLNVRLGVRVYSAGGFVQQENG
jgi:hypothetical protein